MVPHSHSKILALRIASWLSLAMQASLASSRPMHTVQLSKRLVTECLTQMVWAKMDCNRMAWTQMATEHQGKVWNKPPRDGKPAKDNVFNRKPYASLVWNHWGQNLKPHNALFHGLCCTQKWRRWGSQPGASVRPALFGLDYRVHSTTAEATRSNRVLQVLKQLIEPSSPCSWVMQSEAFRILTPSPQDTRTINDIPGPVENLWLYVTILKLYSHNTTD